MSNAEKDVAILVVSCDAYQDLWQPFFQCFFKYWRDCPYPVFLGSNSLRYADSRVSSICVGADKDYSSNLISMLTQMEQEWILVFVEDVFLASTVDTARIAKLASFCQQEGVGHLQLLYRRFNQNYVLTGCALDSEDLIELPVGVPYRVSINACFWKKSNLLEILRPGESAWELESKGTIRSFESAARFCLISGKHTRSPFQWVHGVSKRKWTWETVRFLRQQECRMDCKQRGVESLWFYIYFRIYMVVRYWVFWIVYHVSGPSGMMKIVSKRKW